MAPEAFSNDDAPSTLQGDLAPFPRGPLLTAILAFTGLLLVIELGRLIGRYVLAVRRTAEVRVSAAGLEVRTRTVMLGQTLLESATVIPRDGLVRVTREIRYPGLPMYAGLGALAVGSYIGVGLFVDGARAESPSMLGTGLLIALIGLGADFALSSLPRRGGRSTTGGRRSRRPGAAPGRPAGGREQLAVYLAVSATVMSDSRPPVCSTADTRPREMPAVAEPNTDTSLRSWDRPRIMSMVVVLRCSGRKR
jgi:hypothetical protein